VTTRVGEEEFAVECKTLSIMGLKGEHPGPVAIVADGMGGYSESSPRAWPCIEKSPWLGGGENMSLSEPLPEIFEHFSP